MNRLQVSTDDLVLALEDGWGEIEWYLDTHTGAVRSYGHEPITGEPEDVDPDDEDRYRPIDRLDARTAWEIRRDFAASLDDDRLGERLLDALEGSGAFGRFRRIVDDDPDLRERWHAFHDARLLEEARDLAESFDDILIELV